MIDLKFSQFWVKMSEGECLKEKVKFSLGRPCRMLLVIWPPWQRAERRRLTQTPFVRSVMYTSPAFFPIMPNCGHADLTREGPDALRMSYKNKLNQVQGCTYPNISSVHLCFRMSLRWEERVWSISLGAFLEAS